MNMDETQRLRETLAFWIYEARMLRGQRDQYEAAATHLAAAITNAVGRAENAEGRVRELEDQNARQAESLRDYMAAKAAREAGC